jgi:hypothetical protein
MLAVEDLGWMTRNLNWKGSIDMFLRMVQWSALAIGAVLVASAPARAATVNPADPAVELLPGATYSYLTPSYPDPVPAGSSSIDVFNFFSTSSFSGVLNSTSTIAVGLGAGFEKFDVSWVGSVSGVLASISLGPVGTGGVFNLPLSVPGAESFQLIVDWIANKTEGAAYSMRITVPRGDGETALPLPPALLLFGSALVGLTALGRRRRGRAA